VCPPDSVCDSLTLVDLSVLNGEGKKKWVLVVEDDKDNRDLVIELLHHAGYDARGVAGGAAALEALQGDQPCLVLVDMLMDGMDGRELMSRARRLLTSAPPFVFLTAAHPSRLEEIDAAVLSKPIDFDQLLGVVADHCDP
jgi:CheY-like chemotaxis protein